MSSQYGELRPITGWDMLASLGHPSKFQRVSRLGSVTAQPSSSGRQPNFAALNRGRRLYSSGRPSRWELAHISSLETFSSPIVVYTMFFHCLEIQLWRPVSGSKLYTKGQAVVLNSIVLQCLAAFYILSSPTCTTTDSLPHFCYGRPT